MLLSWLDIGTYDPKYRDDKNEDNVLVWAPEFGVIVAHWWRDPEWWVDSRGDDLPGNVQPTRWMPLPAPPEK